MNSSELSQIFQQELSRPTNVQGDSWGLDATTEEIILLIETPPDKLTADDFSGYLGYCTTGGDDDLRYLFPPILRIWETQLYERDSWFTQYFHQEVSRTNFIERALSPRLKQAALAFMVRALAERLASEKSLSISGVCTSHDWFGYIASFGVFTTAVPALWNHIWDSENQGHAIAILQYLSCLIYEDSNPIFAPWTCDKGGGPPELWRFDSVGFDESWKQENLKFVSSALNTNSIRDWLRSTSNRHSGEQIAKTATSFLTHLEATENDVSERIKLLLIALQTPSGVEITTWDSLRDIATNQ